MSFFYNLLTHSLKSSLSNCDIVLTSRSIVTSEIYSLVDRSTASRHFVNVEVLGFKMADVKKNLLSVILRSKANLSC